MSIIRDARTRVAVLALAVALAAAGASSASAATAARHHDPDRTSLHGLTETVTTLLVNNDQNGPAVGANSSYIDTVRDASGAVIGTTYGACVDAKYESNGDLDAYCAERIELTGGTILTSGFINITAVLYRGGLLSLDAKGVSGVYKGKHGTRFSVTLQSPVLWKSWIVLHG